MYVEVNVGVRNSFLYLLTNHTYFNLILKNWVVNTKEYNILLFFFLEYDKRSFWLVL